jgi:hypothetical protein
MAANGHVPMGRSDGWQDGLDLAQQLLDAQQVAVAQHDLQRGDLAVGSQHVKAIDPGRVPPTP